MAKDLVIKSNRYGMELILSDQLPFPELLQIIGDKFKESGNFFKNARMAVSFSGRELSDEEAMQIVDTITANSAIQIVSIMERGGLQEERMKAVLDSSQDGAQKRGEKAGKAKEEEAEPADDQNGFYKGNLRSGQILECPSNITLIGDVNPGAKIISSGNVVILGSLKGNACAGAGGDDSCFIFALDMQPIQLQIGDNIAKSPDKEKESKHLFKRDKGSVNPYVPQIAVARNGVIYIEPMTKGCLDTM